MGRIHELAIDLAGAERLNRNILQVVGELDPQTAQDRALHPCLYPVGKRMATLKSEMATLAAHTSEEALALGLLVLDDFIFSAPDDREAHAALRGVIDYLAREAGRTPAGLGIFLDALEESDARLAVEGDGEGLSDAA